MSLKGTKEAKEWGLASLLDNRFLLLSLASSQAWWSSFLTNIDLDPRLRIIAAVQKVDYLIKWTLEWQGPRSLLYLRKVRRSPLWIGILSLVP